MRVKNKLLEVSAHGRCDRTAKEIDIVHALIRVSSPKMINMNSENFPASILYGRVKVV
jgi:hypothetical protein